MGGGTYEVFYQHLTDLWSLIYAIFVYFLIYLKIWLQIKYYGGFCCRFGRTIENSTIIVNKTFFNSAAAVNMNHFVHYVC